MLALLKRKPKPPVMIVPPQAVEPAVRRNKQQNIKVSEDCSVAFAALAEAYGLSKAALFEDMVAERLETARGQGLALKIANG
ncbi:MAG: hypothetical protein ACLPWS_20965 [Rhodomicrobium sp.]